MPIRAPETPVEGDIRLHQVVHVLEHMRTEKFPEGILLAHDLGNHAHCRINSNCPEAVKLNRVMLEAGLEFSEFLQAYTEQYRPIVPPVNTNRDFPQYRGTIALEIMGQQVEVDIGEQLRRVMPRRLEQALYQAEDLRYRAIELVKGWQYAYHSAVLAAMDGKELKQLKLPVADMLRFSCHVTSDDQHYLFLFPFKYNPQWLVNRNERYALSPRDVDWLKADIYICIPVTSGNKILKPSLQNAFGRLFSHYHGNHGDCWGFVPLPERWDGTVRQLFNLKDSLEKAIATINRSSLMQHEPVDWPHVDDLVARAKFLGAEGTKRQGDERPEQDIYPLERDGEGDEEDWDEDMDLPEPEPIAPRRGWGQRRI